MSFSTDNTRGYSYREPHIWKGFSSLVKQGVSMKEDELSGFLSRKTKGFSKNKKLRFLCKKEAISHSMQKTILYLKVSSLGFLKKWDPGTLDLQLRISSDLQ